MNTRDGHSLVRWRARALSRVRIACVLKDTTAAAARGSPSAQRTVDGRRRLWHTTTRASRPLVGWLRPVFLLRGRGSRCDGLAVAARAGRRIGVAGRAPGEGSNRVLKIRLRRMGAKHQPSYRVVVADARSPRDG